MEMIGKTQKQIIVSDQVAHLSTNPSNTLVWFSLLYAIYIIMRCAISWVAKVSHNFK